MAKEKRVVKRGWLQAKLGEFRQLCRLSGLKVTPQRLAVYEVLVKSNEHPSAEMVFKEVRQRLPDISLDTVNRTLLTLSEIGAAFIVEGSGDVRRYDANCQNHQHFKCVKCKRIVDFHSKKFDNIPVPKEIRDKFTVLRKTVYLEGICDVCTDNIAQQC
jgi:Fur family peroxide stress response transcriptional regulator